MAYQGRVPGAGRNTDRLVPSSSQQPFLQQLPQPQFGQSAPVAGRNPPYATQQQQPQQQTYNNYAQINPTIGRGQIPDQPRGAAPGIQREQFQEDTLTDDQKDEIDEAFKIFDLDRDDCLDFHETRIAFRALGFDLPKAEISQLILQYGRPKANVNLPPTNHRRQQQQQPQFHPSQMLMPHPAFSQLAAQKIRDRDPETEILRAFKLFDLGGKDLINMEDLKRVARELGENNLEEHEFQTMIEEFDYDDQGGIPYEVFRNICLQ